MAPTTSATVTSVRPALERVSRHGSAAGTAAGVPLQNAGAGSPPGNALPSAGVLSAVVASAGVASTGVPSAVVVSAGVTSTVVTSGVVPAADAAAHSGVRTGAGVSPYRPCHGCSGVIRAAYPVYLA